MPSTFIFAIYFPPQKKQKQNNFAPNKVLSKVVQSIVKSVSVKVN